MHLRVWAALACTAIGLGLASPALCEPPPVAYIDHVYPSGLTLSAAARVKRSGGFLPISGSTLDLEPGDEIYMRKPDAVITVRYLANNTVVSVTGARTAGADKPDWTVQRPSLPGLTGGALALLKAAFKAAFDEVDQSGAAAAMSASRGIAVSGTCFNDTGRSDVPASFSIPVLMAGRSQIVEGPRALFVSWRGGAEPFSVVLADTATAAIISKSANVHDGCAVRLPQTDLKPGRYRLSVVDANNTRLEEDSLYVVEQAPKMPQQLRDAPLPDEARQLYFATWLAAIDQGEWAFEAQQLVASMDCHSAAVQDWLRRWGGVPACS
jgi:hypothetical protein